MHASNNNYSFSAPAHAPEPAPPGPGSERALGDIIDRELSVPTQGGGVCVQRDFPPFPTPCVFYVDKIKHILARMLIFFRPIHWSMC